MVRDRFQRREKSELIYVTFDTELNYKFHSSWEKTEKDRFVPESVRDYKVQVLNGSDWKTVADVKANYQRRRIHRFNAVETSKIRVLVSATNGDKSARIYEVRAYNE